MYSLSERVMKLIAEDTKFVDMADQITPQDGLVYCRDDSKEGYKYHPTAGISQTVVDELESGELKLYYHKGDEKIELIHTRCQKGGGRLWFKCPLCDQRCGKLYRPLFTPCYACRKCHRLVYRSQYKSATIGEIMHLNSVLAEIIPMIKTSRRR